MVNKADVCKQVLAGLGTATVTLADAVAKAEAIKPLKNKNKVGTWKYHLVANGAVVTKVNDVVMVAAPVVAAVAPVVATPVVAPVVTKTE